MCNASTDWPLTIHGDGEIRNEIVASLKAQRVHFVNYGRQAMLKAILRNKALINEKKVGFAEPFPPLGEAVSVYQTDYFTSLCSAERRLEDVVAVEGGDRDVLVDAKYWNAVQWRDHMFRLPALCNNSPPMSLHIGVEVIPAWRAPRRGRSRPPASCWRDCRNRSGTARNRGVDLPHQVHRQIVEIILDRMGALRPVPLAFVEARHGRQVHGMRRLDASSTPASPRRTRSVKKMWS
jgi:hypothetical protein